MLRTSKGSKQIQERVDVFVFLHNKKCLICHHPFALCVSVVMQHIDCCALKSTMHAASIYSSELQHSAECRAVGWMRIAEGNPLFLNLAPIGQYCSSGSHNQWACLRHSPASLPRFPVPTNKEIASSSPGAL